MYFVADLEGSVDGRRHVAGRSALDDRRLAGLVGPAPDLLDLHARPAVVVARLGDRPDEHDLGRLRPASSIGGGIMQSASGAPTCGRTNAERRRGGEHAEDAADAARRHRPE